MSWTPAGTLPAGSYTAVVRTPLSAKGKSAPSIEIPFTMVQSRAKPPTSVVVESLQRVVVGSGPLHHLSLDELPRGKYFDMIKAAIEERGPLSRWRSTSAVERSIREPPRGR